MKTIEERAKEHFAPCWKGSLIDAYVQGATEQKAIDEVNKLVYATEEARKSYELVIDKACEWLETNWYENNGQFIFAIGDFRKAMEE